VEKNNPEPVFHPGIRTINVLIFSILKLHCPIRLVHADGSLALNSFNNQLPLSFYRFTSQRHVKPDKQPVLLQTVHAERSSEAQTLALLPL